MDYHPLTILSGESLAALAVHIGTTSRSLRIDGWNGTTVTFQALENGTDFGDLYDESGEVTFTVAASRFLVLPSQAFAGVRYLKFRSGTAAVPVNQSADRVAMLITEPLGFEAARLA